MTLSWPVIVFFACAGSLGLSALITQVLARPGSRLAVLDLPNERSLHDRPTPRTGGLAILTATLAGWIPLFVMFGMPRMVLALVAATLLVAAVSFADDRGGVPAPVRFAVHLGAAVVLLLGELWLDHAPHPGGGALPAGLGAALAVVFVVWMINLYNFMDGMDGFAGSMTLIGFGVLGTAFWTHGDPTSSITCFTVAASAFGFLAFNFPPAKIFMGDVGSAPLGFLAAALSLFADRTGALPLWASCLAFSPFIVDATVTIVRRLLRGEKIWQAHRTHYYQRLVQAGWGHRRTVLVEIGLMLVAGAAALVARGQDAAVQWGILCAFAVLYVVAMRAVARLERVRAPASPPAAP